MKIRLLPDIDLARIAPMPVDQKRNALEQFKFGRPTISYDPLRACTHDLFNIHPELFGVAAPSEWSQIDRRLILKSKSVDELASNRLVARSLYDFGVRHELRGRSQEFFPLAMGQGHRVSFWLPMILSYQGRALVPFIDPRRSRGLTAAGRRFAFSMMHERIRAADADYAEVRFGIFQFAKTSDDQRPTVLHTDDGIDRYSFSELEAMIKSTYAIWQEVCEGRDAETKRKAGGERGSLI